LFVVFGIFHRSDLSFDAVVKFLPLDFVYVSRWGLHWRV